MQARIEGRNTWNISKTARTNIIGGPYLGGNYWSDYTGIDADGDGQGDMPYDIPGGTNKDYLSLVEYVLKPNVSIYTDKTTYTTGERMHIGLDVKNPSESPQSVSFVLSLETPRRDYTLIDRIVTLPAGLYYSNPDIVSFRLPNIPAGTYIWQVILDDPETGEIIGEDTATWRFYRSVARAPTVDITELLKQATPIIEFGE